MNGSIKTSKRAWCSAALCAAAGFLALSVYLHWSREITYSWLTIAAVCALAAVGQRWFAEKRQRVRGCGLVFGICFVLLQICGNRITTMNTLAETGFEFCWLLLAVIALAPAAGGFFVLFIQMVEKTQKCPASPKKNSRMVFWGSAALLLLCWLPYLLAFYPGLFTYDISWQYEQYQTWNLNTHHPLLHTLLVGWFCDLGWHLFGYPAKGLLLYTLFQMALMALAMASAIRLLYRHHAPCWLCVLILAADAVLPFNSLLAISSTKDTLFAGSVLYLAVVLMELALNREIITKPGWIVRFVLALTAVGLMRNNGFICILALVLAGIIWIVRGYKGAFRLVVFALCGMVAYSGINAGLQAATDAEDGHIREMLSVPLQQMARVYTLTDDEAKPEIAQWLPTVELYSPQLADMVKNTFNASKEQLPEVFRLWAKIGLRHPVIYLDSMLVTSAGFYYIDAKPTGQYLETSFHTDKARWMVDDSKWPALRERVAKRYSNNEYLDIPFLNILLSPALWVWLMLLCIGAGVCCRSRHVVLSGVPLAALYLTALLSPCVMVRYVYPFMLCAPLLLGGLMLAKQGSKEN